MTKTMIQVAVDAGGGRTFPGTVRKLSAQAAEALFRQSICPPIHSGRRVYLAFTSTSNDVILPVEATLKESADLPPLRSITFQFLQQQPRVRELVGTGPVTNRRRSTRVPAGEHGAEVRLVLPPAVVPLLPEIPGKAVFENDQVSIEAQVDNLSHTGIAVLVDHEVETAFVVSDRLHAVLRFPGSESELEIAARIRHRVTRGAQYLYGLEFDWAATEGAREKQNTLTLSLVQLRSTT
jgi:hypothetical protein